MKLFKKIWIFSLFIKIGLAAWLPLAADEAYYWVWSNHPQLSYFDHPPMVAWLFGIGQIFEGWGGAVRWPGILLHHSSLLLWALSFRDVLHPSQLIAWLVLMLLAPLMGPGSLILTPDSPLLFFWALSTYCLSQLWKSQGHWKWALGTGLAMGLAFDSKYVAALLAPLSLIWWWSLGTKRPSLSKWLPALFLAGILGTAPVWLWNLQNDFVSFAFQLDHGLGRSWKPSWTFAYIGAQLALLLPPIFYLAARAKAPLWMKAWAWGPLVFFGLTSFRGYVEANWPIVAQPALLAMAVLGVQKSWHRWALRISAMVWAVALVVTLSLVLWPWSTRLVTQTKLEELHSYDQLILVAQDLEPLYARSYQVAAKLHFALKRPVYKLKGMNRRDFYDFIPQSQPQGSQFFVVLHHDDVLPTPWNSWRIAKEIQVDNRYKILHLMAP